MSSWQLWISAKESIPKHNVKVLLLIECRKGGVIVFNSKNKGTETVRKFNVMTVGRACELPYQREDGSNILWCPEIDEYHYHDFTVLYWMPLPSAPPGIEIGRENE